MAYCCKPARHENIISTGADNRSQPTDNETVLIASQVSKTFEHIETYSDGKKVATSQS